MLSIECPDANEYDPLQSEVDPSRLLECTMAVFPVSRPGPKDMAPIAGMMLTSLFDECTNNPIPLLAVFGTKDNVTNYNGDTTNKDGWGKYPGIESHIKFWAKKNQTNSFQTDTLSKANSYNKKYIVCEKYLNNINGHEVRFYKVVNGGHDWPENLGNEKISTSEEIWNFFSKYLK